MLAAGLPALLAAQAVFRGGVDLVNLGVTVVDKKGEFVTALTADNFEIFEDGQKQSISQFLTGSSDEITRPELHIGVLFDTSGSMELDLKMSRSAAIKFMNTLTDAADITLVDFDTEVRTARYTQAEFPRLVERIRGRKSDGFTALYDALGVYLDGANDQDGRKIMVVYTDGGDTRSAITYSEVLTLLKATDVTVYAIGFLQNQLKSQQMESQLRLRQMAEVTGGQAFFLMSLENLDRVYEDIRKEISAQFSIGFLSTNTEADGRWRNLDVKLRGTDKELRIRSRKGYFAPYKEKEGERDH
jgi:Ca-activated chloride channel family protein